MGSRNDQRKRRLLTLIGGAALAAAASGAVGCEGDTEVECQTTRQYFAEAVWPVVGDKCFPCHNLQGLARETKYVLKGSSETGFIDHNLDTIRDVALFERDGKSLWLLKPTGEIEHGGGKVLTRDDPDYKTMLGLVTRLQADEETCQPSEGAAFAGLELADEKVTLRKASLILAGRLPSDEELRRVEEGGFPALEGVLDEMMVEERFIDWVKQAYGDIMQTDFYLRNGAVDQIDDQYADARWYENAPKELLSQFGLQDADELARFTNHAVAREPLDLIGWVVKNDRPFTEILTADFSVFTPLSARTFGAIDVEFDDPNDIHELSPGKYPPYSADGDTVDFPHAGVLTSPIFLSRWPTTPTNINRARARVFMLFFLGTDILKRGTRPVDQTQVTALNPQRDDPNCAMCHITMDPIAGCFQAFDDNGRFDPEPEWYSDVWPPGFGDQKLALGDSAYGLPWLAQNAVRDERFPLGVVFNVYRGLTGREPLVAPSDFDDPLYKAQFAAFMAQSELFRTIADEFVKSGHNFKVVVKELVLSPYFRAVNSVPLDEERLVAFGDVGMARLLAPELLHDKVMAVLGIPWGNPDDPYLAPRPRNISDTGRFQLYYGGVDFDDVSARITEPNGLMAAVAERMAVEMSCVAVPADFSRLPDDRKLFKPVEIDGVVYDPIDMEPESVQGLAVPQAEAGIKKTIQYLHSHILGEDLALSDPEIERSYQLFLQTWREGRDKLEADEVGTGLPWACRSTEDFYSGKPLPEAQQVTEDDTYTIRAWMAVGTYLLSDYRFLYE